MSVGGDGQYRQVSKKTRGACIKTRNAYTLRPLTQSHLTLKPLGEGTPQLTKNFSFRGKSGPKQGLFHWQKFSNKNQKSLGKNTKNTHKKTQRSKFRKKKPEKAAKQGICPPLYPPPPPSPAQDPLQIGPTEGTFKKKCRFCPGTQQGLPLWVHRVQRSLRTIRQETSKKLVRL